LLAAAAASATTHARADTDVDLSGRLESGVELKELKHGESETKGKLKAKTERKAKARLVLEVDMSSLDKELELQEAYIDQRLGDKEDGRSLEIGLGEKTLGLEYDLGDDDRLPIKRTLLYRKLETFAYVGHETTVRYRSEAAPHSRDVDLMLSLGYAESLDVDTILGLKQEFAPDWYWGTWAMVQSDKISSGRQMVWAFIGSLLWMESANRLELELASGQDPFESEFQKTFGDGKSRYFASAKALYGYFFDFGGDSGLQPYVSATTYRYDVELPRYDAVETLVGVNYKITKALQVDASVDVVGTNSKAEPSERTYNDSFANVEAKYVF
jgi:hypothetical protein